MDNFIRGRSISTSGEQVPEHVVSHALTMKAMVPHYASCIIEVQEKATGKYLLIHANEDAGKKRSIVGAGVLRPLCMTADPKFCTFAPVPESWMKSQKLADLKMEKSEKKEPRRPCALGCHFYQAVMGRRHLHTSSHTWDAGRLGMEDEWLPPSNQLVTGVFLQVQIMVSAALDAPNTEYVVQPWGSSLAWEESLHTCPFVYGGF
jgi:hypothetical protein